MEYFIEAQHLVKKFEQHTALNDVSISIPKGQVFGLLGPNGAGKTTFIRIINRITVPDSGRVLFDGRPFERPTSCASVTCPRSAASTKR